MSKPMTVVNKEKLIEAINSVEANGPLTNRAELYKQVAEVYNKNTDGVTASITYSIVSLRIAEWQIAVKTPVGKRGRKSSSSSATPSPELLKGLKVLTKDDANPIKPNESVVAPEVKTSTDDTRYREYIVKWRNLCQEKIDAEYAKKYPTLKVPQVKVEY